jgi:dTDP-4-amino-4,6-dideoxygalactose transaminase
MIPFNKPYLTGKELEYINDAVVSGKISGNGLFTKKCQNYFEKEYSFKKTLLTNSCTQALEMAAILIDIQPGDEVIIPSYTFVSTANPFVLRGAKVIFADSQNNSPNIDAEKIEQLITDKTKAIVPVHYAGISCDMDKLMQLANKYNLYVVEDAAHSVDSTYNDQPLGGIGHLGVFSFHETKNLNCGEGGLLIINENKFIERAEIIWEKGTNRLDFHRGIIKKYEWIDIGSSFSPSEIAAAFLYAQVQNFQSIQKKRIWIWNYYNENLSFLRDRVEFPTIPSYASINGHIFFLVLNDVNERNSFLEHMRKCGILSVFHYQSLHNSPFYKIKHGARELKNADKFSDQLIRLPLYYELTEKELEYIVNSIKEFYL